MSKTDSPRTRTSPQEVRRKSFNVRLRGFDHAEVRAFLTAVADDLERIQAETAILTQEKATLAQDKASLAEENQSLRSELDGAQADPREMATDQAVMVLNQAQQLADSLIDEAMQSSRDLLLTARSQQRDIMEQARDTAKGAVARATATATAEQASGEDASVHDAEYIRMFAKVAQVQFQAVLDALEEHVNRLGAVGVVEEPLRYQQREGA
jgi:DivIVA domain-containing protein